MKGNPYSSEKMPWLAFHDGWPPKAPSQVQLILSDLCQMDCVDLDGHPWCAYRMPGYSSNELFGKDAELSKFGHNNPKRFMSTERVMSLLSEMAAAGVKGLQFTGGGEPLLHPACFEIFERSLELGFECSLVTNGLAMDHRLRVLLSNFAWVRVSIDAGTAETYARSRTTHPSNYVKVLDQIKDLADIIRERKTKTVLGIGFVVMQHNWREIRRAVLMAKEVGAQNIRLSAMFSHEGPLPYIMDFENMKDQVRLAKGQETETFKVHDLFGDRIEDLTLGSPDYPICAKMHYCTYIGADMQVYMCCVYSYNERGKVAGDFGNLAERRFDEFWDSRERKEFMARFDPRKCERCQFNPSNRAMNALLTERPPLHVEFP